MTIQQQIKDTKSRFEIIGISPLLDRALEIAIKVAPTDMAILIQGESGVGKENFSKIIHSMSKRKHNGFIAINCGAIPAGTIDSELFGHEKGSFTSAIESRKGYFETVDKGTIFLDEIGELPLETQSRLLRVLESGEFLKVGSSKVQKTDVRIIAATNKELHDLSLKGKFREDLYYRLSAVTIKIPPLRERTEDIPYLFAKFASDVADKYRIPPLELNPDAIEVIKNFTWPGNIRQLKNFVEQISVLETNRTLSAADIQKYLPAVQSANFALVHDGSATGTGGYQEREILYKFLFDIKRDISDLKNLMFEYIHPSAQQQPAPTSSSAMLLPAHTTEVRKNGFDKHEEYESTPLVYEISENENKDALSLHDQEKDLIQRALSRHHGKRKIAARELGISERTLYRKIKEYHLEENE